MKIEKTKLGWVGIDPFIEGTQKGFVKIILFYMYILHIHILIYYFLFNLIFMHLFPWQQILFQNIILRIPCILLNRGHLGTICFMTILCQ